MSTNFQAIVFNVPADQAPTMLARHLRNYLVAEQIIEAKPSHCTPGTRGRSYAPAPGYTAAVDVPHPHLFSLATNGVEIALGRIVEIDPQGSFKATCPKCGNTFAPGEDMYDALSSWYEGEDDVRVICPQCLAETRLVDWPIRPSWGFGNLVLKFWNWPILRPQFIQELASIAGLQPTVVTGNL
ncbi:MAG: hypothetical protein P8Z41_12620 [Anaerolineales bacterium]